jgi:hypothetical protein
LNTHGTPSEKVIEAFEEVIPHIEEDELALEESLIDFGIIFEVFRLIHLRIMDIIV